MMWGCLKSVPRRSYFLPISKSQTQVVATRSGGPPRRANVHTFLLPSESSWPGLGTSRQLSGPGGFSSGIPSLSSSSSHSSPSPSLSVSTWELLGTEGQLSRVSWWPSPSLVEKMHYADEKNISG